MARINPTWSPGLVSGTEGGAIGLGDLSLPHHGRGVKSLVVAGIPDGATLSDDRGNSFTATGGHTDAKIKLRRWDLSALSISPVNDTNITLTAIARGPAGHGRATESVIVNPLAPTVSWSPATASGQQGTPIVLGTIGDMPNGLPGDSNSIASLIVSGIPTGGTLSDGHGNSSAPGATSANVLGWTLSSLTLTDNTPGTVTLTATAVDRDAEGNQSGPSSATETVTVSPTPPPLPTFSFALNTSSLGTLEDGGTQLQNSTSVGRFTGAGGNPGDSFTFTLGGSGAASFTLDPNSGALSTGSANVMGANVYPLTVEVNDTTLGTHSSAQPFDVWVGSFFSDTVNLAAAETSASGVTGPTIAYGLLGDDTISAAGIAGPVWFVGGPGADTMTGGTGANTYVYAATNESPNQFFGFAGDTITNFNAATDKIDTTAIAGITNVQGQLTSGQLVAADSIAWLTNGGNTVVYGNPTNVAVSQSDAQMAILLNSTPPLTLSNFLHA